MIFALERTTSALYLLSLEKLSNGYRITHFDKRILNHKTPHDALMNGLQQMNPFEHNRELMMGIHDADLIIRHIHFAATYTRAKMYQFCQAKFAEQLPQPLKNYSWDAYPLRAYQGDGHYCLCVAYPLEKIIFLQEILALFSLRLQVLEPSVCALARASLLLLQMPKALFLLYEHQAFTLVRIIQGEVFALWQFKNLKDLTNNLAALLVASEKIIVMSDDAQVNFDIPHLHTLDIMQYLQMTHGLQAKDARLLPAVGLALRGYRA